MLSAIRAASERRRRPSVAPRVSSTGRDGKKLEGPALILVVEDDADARETFAAYLTKAGYRVEQAANGQEALDAITRSKPALVVMDLSMPVLDGWEATRRIKSDAATSDVFVIAVTGHSTDQGLRRATDLGADAVLTKPCQPGTILAGIWALLDSVVLANAHQRRGRCAVNVAPAASVDFASSVPPCASATCDAM